jgi:hypothetical protein
MIRATKASAVRLDKFLRVSADYLGLNHRAGSRSMQQESLRLTAPGRPTIPARSSHGDCR